MAPADWIVIIVFLGGTLAIGLWASRRAREDSASYFKSSGALPWWLLGVSIVATTFAADTPLAIGGLVRTDGISGNWFWWAQAPMVLAGVFFFARLWRRANPMTDMEFIDQRYSGPEASFLRGFKAIYLAIPYGCLVMGWVNKAMASIIGMVFPPLPRIPLVDGALVALVLATPLGNAVGDEARAVLEASDDPAALVIQANETMALAEGADDPVAADLIVLRSRVNELKILGLLFLVCLAYTAFAGLWGVVITDFIQFWIAMGGCILLAILAVRACGGMDAMIEGVVAEVGVDGAGRMLAMVPEMQMIAPEGGPGVGLRFLLFVLLSWWVVGFTDGGSYHAQRLLAARSERDAALGYFVFAVAQYGVRMWPWIVVGVAAVVLFPGLGTGEAEGGFILVMRDLLGTGWLGLLVASFLAAYLSTISTQLNLSASYLVNDVYRPFMRPGRAERHYVRAGTMATVLVAFCGAVVSLFLDSIVGAWMLILALNGGIGLIYILRWYWWRISAWSEIVCLGALLLLAPITAFAGPTLGAIVGAGFLAEGTAEAIRPWLRYPATLLISVPLSVGVAIAATILLRPVSREKLLAFERQVAVGGPGWRRIDDDIRKEQADFRPQCLLSPARLGAWGLAVFGVYAALFGCGALIFGDLWALGTNTGRWFGTGLMAASAASAVLVAWLLGRRS